VPTAAAQSTSGTSPLLAWGYNSSGQLGDGNTTDSALPVNVKLPTGTKVRKLAAGYDHSLAVTSTGSVLAWGLNASGELGDGNHTNSHVPVKVKLPKGTTVTKVAAGGFYSLAVTSTGSMLAWGYNSKGQLGDGSKAQTDLPVKVKLPTGTKVTKVAAGYYHSLAVTSTGAVLAWGDNAHGELGNGSTTNSHVPVQVKLPTGTKVIAVAAGYDDSFALTSTGSVLAWGLNASGQLGDGNTTDSHVPVQVKLPTGTTVTRLAAGHGHVLAVTSMGKLRAWGSNASGQLGDGNTASSDVPVKVKLPTGTTVRNVAAGYYHSVAVTSTGKLLAWGNNSYGQLGNGTTASSHLPVKVKLPKGTTVSKVAAGHGHSLAL
jgi:alpha-tubulin suppressor-like RCC1 family protein